MADDAAAGLALLELAREAGLGSLAVLIGKRPAEPDDMTRRIVAAVSDDFELGPSSFRLRKTASS